MKTEKKISKAVLFVIAMLVVLLFLFLAFENLAEDSTASSSFNEASCFPKAGTQLNMVDKFELESGIYGET